MTPAGRWRIALSLLPTLHCAPRGPAPTALRDPPVALAGRYWGRWSDTPEHTRVVVWIDGDTRRFRGAWDLPPWHGEFDGGEDASGALAVRWQQEGVIAVHNVTTRALRWSRDPRTGSLRGADGDGAVMELTPARAPFAGLREGLWMSRWTGLPPGLAVETVLSREGDGRWRATYAYQGREGSFLGESRGDALGIRWREVSGRDAVSEGRGALLRMRTGFEGSYGLGEAVDGTGRWSIEPAPMDQNR